MFLDLSSTSKQFTIAPGLPADYHGPLIPGSKMISATGKPGTMIFQEIKEESFNMRLSIFRFLRKIKLIFHHDPAFLQVPIAVKNTFQFRNKEISHAEIRENQYMLLHKLVNPIESVFEKDKEYFLLDLQFPKATIEKLYGSFTELKDSYSKKGGFVFTPPRPMPQEVKDIVQLVLRPPYEQRKLSYLFEIKVRECLFLLFSQQFSSPAFTGKLNMEEKEKITGLAGMLVRQLADYFPLSDLARKVQMNENKLQNGFKELYGLRVFEYQRNARMEEARRLIKEEGMQVKEVYTLVGYMSPSGFINEFKKYFGFPPGSLKKNNRLF